MIIQSIKTLSYIPKDYKALEIYQKKLIEISSVQPDQLPYSTADEHPKSEINSWQLLTISPVTTLITY